MDRNTNSKFIVFTTNRSGSEWVISTLNSIPNVSAQGELFLPRPRVSERRWDSDFARPRFIETRPTGLSFRPFSVFSYLDRLYDTPGAVGFKLMYAQLGLYPEILPYLVQNGVRVVHLVRKNHLDVLLSFAVKAKLGKAHLLAGQSGPGELSVTLETKDLLKKLRRLELKQNAARKLLKVFRLPYIEVVYENLLQDPLHFRVVWDFLSIQPEQALPQSTLVKIRRGGHREVILNYDEVRQCLRYSKFAHLLE